MLSSMCFQNYHQDCRQESGQNESIKEVHHFSQLQDKAAHSCGRLHLTIPKKCMITCSTLHGLLDYPLWQAGKSNANLTQIQISVKLTGQSCLIPQGLGSPKRTDRSKHHSMPSQSLTCCAPAVDFNEIRDSFDSFCDWTWSCVHLSGLV